MHFKDAIVHFETCISAYRWRITVTLVTVIPLCMAGIVRSGH
ncbi:MAG: hypothetical protein V4582_19950 [Pseudomonadota bacterium]